MDFSDEILLVECVIALIASYYEWNIKARIINYFIARRAFTWRYKQEVRLMTHLRHKGPYR